MSIRFTRNRGSVDHTYLLNNINLKNVTEIKDLGVIIDSKLLFGFIKRSTKHFKSFRALLNLFYAFICSKLFFASAVWNPQYQIYINRIESIQNIFLKYLSLRCNIDLYLGYAPLMRNFGILSLKDRRVVSVLVLFFKIFKTLVYAPEIYNKINLKLSSRSFRSNELFSVPFRNTNYGQNAPICRLSRLFNEYYNDLSPFQSNVERFRFSIKTLLVSRIWNLYFL